MKYEPMIQSLSIVFPVCNAEATIQQHIMTLLDMAADLTHRFEILIVDDASNDSTEELVWELSRQFPQVRMTRHPRTMGSATAAQTGIQLSTGDVIFVHNRPSRVRSNDFHYLWQHRGQLSSDQVHRLEGESGGIQMMRRHVARQSSDAQSDPHSEFRRVAQLNSSSKEKKFRQPSYLSKANERAGIA